MPNDNIQRAIKKGAGEVDGAMFEEFSYEGYGPAGVGLIIDVLTDNRNRTTAEVRHALTKMGGSMGESNAVAWNFDTRGVIRIDAGRCDEDFLMDAALEAGADDVQETDGVFEVFTVPNDLAAVSEALRGGDIPIETAGIEKVPKTLVKVEGKDAKRTLRLMDMLEDLDDVQRVSANFDIPDEFLQEE
jgi:YebC/PmpR family DNA-binding regulatory protein